MVDLAGRRVGGLHCVSLLTFRQRLLRIEPGPGIDISASIVCRFFSRHYVEPCKQRSGRNSFVWRRADISCYWLMPCIRLSVQRILAAFPAPVCVLVSRLCPGNCSGNLADKAKRNGSTSFIG